MKGIGAITLAAALLAGCASRGGTHYFTPDAPTRVGDTDAGGWLRRLPAPAQALDVSLYRFQDQTGQFKPSDTQFSYSRAVSQGGDALLVGALLSAGNGSWFRVLDRTALEDLLKERQIIREMRSLYGNGASAAIGVARPATGDDADPVAPPASSEPGALTRKSTLNAITGTPPVQQNTAPLLPPLRFAGLLLTGGVIGYDSNIRTLGAGLRILGVGANTEVRHDLVTVSLATLSTQSGEVLHNVVTQKGIYSVRTQGGAFRYVDDTTLLELEAGIGVNEPGLVALRRAIETAVYGMVVEGAQKGLWPFASAAEQAEALAEYLARVLPPGVALAVTP
ncbi:MAG: CsgG/HfaB family protein [Stagnimonas sp.]|nr:CsgG/HfaB family protein [Stagnimonas sp.]